MQPIRNTVSKVFSFVNSIARSFSGCIEARTQEVAQAALSVTPPTGMQLRSGQVTVTNSVMEALQILTQDLQADSSVASRMEICSKIKALIRSNFITQEDVSCALFLMRELQRDVVFKAQEKAEIKSTAKIWILYDLIVWIVARGRVQADVNIANNILNWNGGNLYITGVSGKLPDSIGMLMELESMTIDYCDLSEPPSIWHLKELKELELRNSILTSVPSLIGQLINLTRLDLSHNNLTELPYTMSQLTNLRWLDLSGNRLTELPDIWQLTNLWRLNLSNNGLQNLPYSFCQLTNLSWLDLSLNNFGRLPESMIELNNLTYLWLSNNPQLSTLPLGMSQLTRLTNLNIEGTAISPIEINQLVQIWRAASQQDVSKELPLRIERWQKVGQTNDTFDLKNLTKEELGRLNEWFVRLEKTKDFQSDLIDKQDLAKKALDILVEVLKNDSFKEIFFVHAKANEEGCEDRTAMAFNEIYTAYRLVTLPEDAPLKEKIELLLAGAETIALREAVANRLTGLNNQESVEVYLYYENTMQRYAPEGGKPLNLLTAIKTTHYAEGTGQRREIQKEDLYNTVQERRFYHLTEMEIFKKILKSDLTFNGLWGPQDQAFQKRIATRPPRWSEMAQIDRVNRINSERNRAFLESVRSWVGNVLEAEAEPKQPTKRKKHE